MAQKGRYHKDFLGDIFQQAVTSCKEICCVAEISFGVEGRALYSALKTTGAQFVRNEQCEKCWNRARILSLHLRPKLGMPGR